MLLKLMCLLTFVSVARADVVGSWKTETGRVQMLIDKQDQGTTACKIIEVEFTKTERSLNLLRLHLECGAMLVMDMEPQELELQNGKLYLGPDEVGHYSGARLALRLAKDSVVKEITLQEDATGKVQFHHQWTDGFTQLLFDGEMLKQ